MANPYEQFAPANAALTPAKLNPYAQFAVPAAAAAPPAEPSTALDALQSFGSGAVRGAAETAMLPVTINRLAESGADWLFDKGDSLVRTIFGAEQRTPDRKAEIEKLKNGLTGEQLNDLIFSGQDAARGGLDSVLHKPTTTAGEYARTIGEFAAPGALPGRAVRSAPNFAARTGEYVGDLIGNVVMPAIASETAGQLTEGTAAEPWARAAGGVGGAALTAAGRAWNAPEMAVRRATGELTPQQWDEALNLQNNPTGVALTGPEAIAEATGGATALPNLLRVVEGSTEGRVATAPFFAQRPDQVDAAVGNVLDGISPQDALPSTLGPRASEAATGVIDGQRQAINAQTRPLYAAAEPQLLPHAAFQPIAADPRFQAALERLRANAEIGPDYANMPDNSVAVVDAVSKDMLARGEALANRANPLYGPEVAARNSAAGVTSRTAARQSVPQYDQALTEQARLRAVELDPLEQGPIGRIAAASDTQAAGEALLPRNPITGSAGEQADAAARMVAQDDGTTRGLLRQNLADRYSKAATGTQEGVREFSGAKFHKDVAGNANRDGVLDAVMRAIPGAPADEMNILLDVLAATGRRKPIGSATAFNSATMNNDLGANSPLAALFGTVRAAGTNMLTQAGDATKRLALRRNIGALADLFTDPQSVELIRQAGERGAAINFGELLPRTAGQVSPLFREERQ